MIAIDHAALADGRMRSEMSALRAYVGTEMFDHLAGLLEALKVSYMHELATISPESLLLKQGALRQVMVLQRALTGELEETPRI